MPHTTPTTQRLERGPSGPQGFGSRKQSQTLLWLTCTSLVLSSVTILVTLFVNLDFGVMSLFIAPITAFLTIVYHTTILIIARYRALHAAIAAATADNIAGPAMGTVTAAPKRSPATTRWSIGLVCFLCLMWTTAMTLTAVVLGIVIARGDDPSDQSYYTQVGAPGLVFEFIELNVLIALAIAITRARRSEPYGDEWYQL